MLRDLAVRVHGHCFLFSFTHLAQWPQKQAASAATEINRRQCSRNVTARSSSMAMKTHLMIEAFLLRIVRMREHYVSDHTRV